MENAEEARNAPLFEASVYTRGLLAALQFNTFVPTQEEFNLMTERKRKDRKKEASCWKISLPSVHAFRLLFPARSDNACCHSSNKQHKQLLFLFPPFSAAPAWTWASCRRLWAGAATRTAGRGQAETEATQLKVARCSLASPALGRVATGKLGFSGETWVSLKCKCYDNNVPNYSNKPR